MGVDELHVEESRIWFDYLVGVKNEEEFCLC